MTKGSSNRADECYTFVCVKNKKLTGIITIVGSLLVAITMVASNFKATSGGPGTITSLCTQYDDPDFRHMGDPAKDCDWVGGHMKRCRVAGGACPKTCNPNCGVDNGKSSAIIQKRSHEVMTEHNSTIVKESIRKGNQKNKIFTCVDDPKFKLNNNEDKTCTWVGEKSQVRCAKGGALEACPTSCNHPDCAEPSSTMIVKEKITKRNKKNKIICVDDPKFKLHDKKNKTCTWVGESSQVRCEKPGVLEACPTTCYHPDCACSDDPSFRWDDHPKMSCEWVGENPVRCAIEVAAKACPETCNPECANHENA